MNAVTFTEVDIAFWLQQKQRCIRIFTDYSLAMNMRTIENNIRSVVKNTFLMAELQVKILILKRNFRCSLEFAL